MAGLSDFSELALLNDMIAAGAAYTPPTQQWISLHTADPSDTGAAEVTGGSYARFNVADPATFWSAPSSDIISNTIEATFPGMPAANVTHAGVWDASTAGNFLAGDELITPRAYSGGETGRFAPGVLRILWDATTTFYSQYLKDLWLNFQFRNQARTRPTSHTLAIYAGDPFGAGVPIAGSSPQAITFSTPASSGTRHQCTQDNGDIDFSSLTGGDTLDYWLVEDNAGNDLVRRLQSSVSIAANDTIRYPDGTCIIGVD